MRWVEPEDLCAFGMIPEFVGRLPVGGSVSQLEAEALVRILVEPRNALVKQYQRLFEFEDIELDVTEEALAAIADQALSRGTGARGLRAILEEVLLDVMYELPGDDEAGRVVVDLDSVQGETPPTVVPRSADHPDRAAS